MSYYLVLRINNKDLGEIWIGPTCRQRLSEFCIKWINRQSIKDDSTNVFELSDHRAVVYPDFIIFGRGSIRFFRYFGGQIHGGRLFCCAVHMKRVHLQIEIRIQNFFYGVRYDTIPVG